MTDYEKTAVVTWKVLGHDVSAENLYWVDVATHPPRSVLFGYCSNCQRQVSPKGARGGNQCTGKQ